MKLLKMFLVVFLELYLLHETYGKHSPSVIIVGAGPAGIAATTRLLEHNHTNILLLEAENRIGGRVNSVHFGEAVVDLGAEWCHGENLVYELVKDLNILKHSEIPNLAFHSSERDIDQGLGLELMDIMEDIYDPDGHRNEREGRTVGHFCIDKFNSTIHERYHKEPKKLAIARDSLDFFHHYVLGSEGSFSWFEPSAQSDYQDCYGDLNLNWNGRGYKTALEVLMKKLPNPKEQLPFDQKVQLNKQVVNLVWNETASSRAIRILCADNSTYEADHVIFTPSIGVLKAEHEKIFHPALPADKRKAIKNIGFGAVMKIAMHFRENWWGKDNFTGFNFLWADGDKIAAHKEFPEGPVKEDRTWLGEIFSLLPVERNPNVLIAWITGDMVPDIEKLSNETLINGVVFVMKKFLGHKYNVSEPVSFLRTSWFSNPHFRGSYSYQTMEARKNVDETAEIVLARPLLGRDNKPILMFGGEASHPYFYSTVHGAIETGHREANRLIELYNQ